MEHGSNTAPADTAASELFFSLERYLLGETSLAELLEISPDDIAALTTLAEARRKQGLHDEASRLATCCAWLTAPAPSAPPLADATP